MLEAIRNRRSVRFFKDQPVSDEDITEVLKAGFCAPSAHAEAPWHVVVIKNQEAKDKLSGIHRYTRILSKAPVILVACVDRRGEFGHFWIENGSAFMENMLIQAAELGLGTCWIGIQGLKQDDRDAEQIVREICGLPDYLGVIALTPLGHSARYPGPHEPKLPESRVHYESFS